MRQAVELLQKQGQAKWATGLPLHHNVRHGVVFAEIVRYARDNSIDLIVMGTHSRSAVAHALIGSVAEKVVRKAACPVMTIYSQDHQFVMP